jgi:hypothetical protein
MNLRAHGRRILVSATTAVLGLGIAAPLALAGPASAATTHHTRHAGTAAAAHHAPLTGGLTGTTTVTTAPGIATTLIKAGILPLPTIGTRFGIASFSPLKVSYGFPITGGNPDLAGPSGHIYHSGGINFVSRKAHLEIGRFDIDLAAGKIYARSVNYAPARIPVLDLDLSALSVNSSGGRTVLSGIVLRLDPAAASALNATFGIALPTDGSLVFGTARVALGG